MDDLFELILQKVRIFSSNEFIRYRQEALLIVKDIDVDDAIFFVCALAYPDSIIWSNDKKLKNQDSVKVLNTSEIYNIIAK